MEALRAPTTIPAEARDARVESTFTPVKAWALAGGLLLVFQLWVFGKWITGPYFTPVPPGPSDPPTWMKTVLTVWTAVIVAGWPVAVYHFLVKPWRRERRITTDGMLLGAFTFLFFQDPLLNYLNTWCTYNSWLWNRGSWVQDIPGWVSWGKPGAMMPEPLLMNGFGYSYGVLVCTMLGCWVMRRAKLRWPNLGVPGLLGVLIVFTFFFDIVMEGFFLMPMGLFTYPGAIKSLSLFPGTYHQYPIYQGLMWGAVQAGFCSLRFFTDDRGRTFAERGLERVHGGALKKEGTRFLAIFAAISMFFFVFYNLPAQWLAMHAEAWPEDIQKRSYFTMGICGEGTGRLCPHPALPIDQGETSAYIGPGGTVILPEGVELPEIVPFERAE
ncbi:MAG TPA: spirocyclase, AveC family [Alphaproteobacteria bacterium]|nr:spirocyclase, AveC family [Alphaproteobacteria bacterium]